MYLLCILQTRWNPAPAPTVSLNCWWRKVRVAERSVEGRHSRIHQVLKRAPRASVAYLSNELRFVQLQKLCSTSPLTLRSMTDHLVGLETSTGIRQAVRPGSFSVALLTPPVTIAAIAIVYVGGNWINGMTVYGTHSDTGPYWGCALRWKSTCPDLALQMLSNWSTGTTSTWSIWSTYCSAAKPSAVCSPFWETERLGTVRTRHWLPRRDENAPQLNTGTPWSCHLFFHFIELILWIK